LVKKKKKIGFTLLEKGIIDRVDFEKKTEFFQKLMSYWLLKRHSRNGVPILRRLQSMGFKKNNETKKLEEECKKLKSEAEELSDEEKTKIYEELKEQLTYMKRLRQNLEKARLLMELIRYFYFIFSNSI
jgi:hypothetical protein